MFFQETGLWWLPSKAQEEMGPGANADAIAAHAVKVNVFHTMNFVLSFSESIREAVRSGQIEIHGGIYDLETGSVEFLGERARSRPTFHVERRSSRPWNARRPARGGMTLLKQGNERFAVGAPTAATTSTDMREALVKCGRHRLGRRPLRAPQRRQLVIQVALGVLHWQAGRPAGPGAGAHAVRRRGRSYEDLPGR